MEIFKDIKGYEETYQISDIGTVLRKGHYRTDITNRSRYYSEKILAPIKSHSGYLRIGLWKEGKVKRCFIHRLVAEAFIPNTDKLPQINHIDENKENNCVENLEWCTSKYNCNYGTRTKRQAETIKGNKHPKPMLGKIGKKHPCSKPIYQYDLDGNFIKKWDCAGDVQREVGYGRGNLNNCALGKCQTAYGYKWAFKEDKLCA